MPDEKKQTVLMVEMVGEVADRIAGAYLDGKLREPDEVMDLAGEIVAYALATWVTKGEGL